MSKTLEFPKGFLWGTATSAFQTEGNNSNTDWWVWEHNKPADKKYPLDTSDIACDSYNRYPEDLDLAKQMNNNAIRVSVEWARLEPEEGHFDRNEFEHYRKVLTSARERGLKTFVTLHHFTNPKWFADKGEWTISKAPDYFSRYAVECVKELGDLIDVVLTINEPQVYSLMRYLRGMWFQYQTDPIRALFAQVNMLRAHNKAYKAIKEINKDMKIGIVQHITWYEPANKKDSDLISTVISKISYFFGSDLFLMLCKNNLDLIGVNYYFTNLVDGFKFKNPNQPVNDMGWWIYSEGLKKVLLALKKYNLPVYITENGLADAQDSYRSKFLEQMLSACHEAIQGGCDLKGYFYWSLLDNYEWSDGYWPRFGIINIDRNNGLARIPRPSFDYYSSICKNNSITSDDQA